LFVKEREKERKAGFYNVMGEAAGPAPYGQLSHDEIRSWNFFATAKNR